MDEQVLLALASKLGWPVVIVYVLVQLGLSLWGKARAKSPADPALPESPAAPPKYPLADKVLKAMFGRKAPAAEAAHPDLVEKLADEFNGLRERLRARPGRPADGPPQ